METDSWLLNRTIYLLQRNSATSSRGRFSTAIAVSAGLAETIHARLLPLSIEFSTGERPQPTRAARGWNGRSSTVGKVAALGSLGVKNVDVPFRP